MLRQHTYSYSGRWIVPIHGDVWDLALIESPGVLVPALDIHHTDGSKLQSPVAASSVLPSLTVIVAGTNLRVARRGRS